MEIVSNDCGVRMLEGRMLMRMSEFMGLSHEKQSDVVFWKEVDELHTQFSPLLYVQVTRFECGGYSIGISCSLLLSEFFMVDNFLKKWADTHINIKTQTQTKTPIFYHPHLKNPEFELSPPISTITKNKVLSITFKVTCCEDAKFTHHESWRELAMICVEKAEQKLERKMGEIFCLWMMDPSCEALRIRVERCSRSTISITTSGLEMKNQIIACTHTTSSWDEGNKPVYVCRWIGGSVCDEGHVMVVVPHRNHNFSALTVLVSFPARNKGV